MEETDFFSFCEEDKKECYRLDNLYLQTKSHHHKSKGVNTGFYQGSKRIGHDQ